ncbi:outer membrane protein [Legionella oakridgensis]|uniref:outer membrane protein n=1 Tax=Legionella oakridgensis TaxID=29423 RepID=UPI0003DE4B42|nr:outer membrane beta-barrel protein [Legionella oakridgensis]ETO93932.1 hypothetical protein LOR_78c22620 [Legionella oakridgensis RV-2-2007]
MKYKLLFILMWCWPLIGLGYDLSGLYLGPSIGYEFNPIEYQVISPPASDSISRRTYNAQGLVGGGVIGLGKQFNRIYLGIEVRGLVSGAEASETFNSLGGQQSLSISQENTKSAGARLGFQLNPNWMPYLYVGNVWSALKVTETNTIGSLNFNSSDSIKKTLSNPAVGGGIILPLTEALKINMNFFHVFYNDKTSHLVTLFPNFQKEAHYSPKQNIFLFDVVYLFHI